MNQRTNSRPMGRTQFAPIFLVKANGVTVEFTDDRGEAHAAFASSNSTIKEMFKVEANGSAVRLKHMINGRDVMRREEVLLEAA